MKATVKKILPNAEVREKTEQVKRKDCQKYVQNVVESKIQTKCGHLSNLTAETRLR